MTRSARILGLIGLLGMGALAPCHGSAPPPGAHTFPDVDDHARLLCADGCFGFAGPDREEILLRHGRRIFDVEVNVIRNCPVWAHGLCAVDFVG